MSDSASFPSLARGRYAQAVLFTVGLVTTMDVYIVALLIEPMKHNLGLTDVQVGIATSTAFYITYALLSAPMGMLADRLNRVRLLQIAILLWCGGLAITGLSHDLWLLSCSKAIAGIGAAVSYPAAMSLLSDYFAPDRRAFAMMSYAIGTTLGGVCATLIGGFSFAALTRAAAVDPQALLGLEPWRATSLIFAAAGLVIIPALMMMREPVRQEIGEGAGGGTFRELWAYRRFLIPNLIAIMCLSGVGNSLATWILPSLIRLYGQQPGDFAAWYSAVTLLSGLLAMFAAAKLIETARRRKGESGMMRPAIWSSLFLAPTCALAMTPNVPWFAVVTALFTFFGAVGIMIPVVAFTFRLPNELRGLAMGLQAVFAAVAGATISPLVALVSAGLGGDMMIGRAMAVVGIPFSLLAALCLWAASRPDTDAKEASDLT